MGEKTNILLRGIFSVGSGIVAFLLGGFDVLFMTLVALVVLDFVSGLIEAGVNNKLSSAIFFWGIAKKVYLFLLVAVCQLVQVVMGNIIPLREVILTFFIANEALSILENASRLGVPFPESLKSVLLNLKSSKEIKKLEVVERKLIDEGDATDENK